MDGLQDGEIFLSLSAYVTAYIVTHVLLVSIFERHRSCSAGARIMPAKQIRKPFPYPGRLRRYRLACERLPGCRATVRKAQRPRINNCSAGNSVCPLGPPREDFALSLSRRENRKTQECKWAGSRCPVLLTKPGHHPLTLLWGKRGELCGYRAEERGTAPSSWGENGFSNENQGCFGLRAG